MAWPDFKSMYATKPKLLPLLLARLEEIGAKLEESTDRAVELHHSTETTRGNGVRHTYGLLSRGHNSKQAELLFRAEEEDERFVSIQPVAPFTASDFIPDLAVAVLPFRIGTTEDIECFIQTLQTNPAIHIVVLRRMVEAARHLEISKLGLPVASTRKRLK